METLKFKGEICHTFGDTPRLGEKISNCTLTSSTLSDIRCSDFKGKRLVLNIFPSLDTPVCAESVRKFNVAASKCPDTIVLCISMDLPFAMSRFCSVEGIKNVISASAFRSPAFVEKIGLLIIDGPLRGLLARSVIILDKNHHVIYSDTVPDIADNPDYRSIADILDCSF